MPLLYYTFPNHIDYTRTKKPCSIEQGFSIWLLSSQRGHLHRLDVQGGVLGKEMRIRILHRPKATSDAKCLLMVLGLVPFAYK